MDVVEFKWKKSTKQSDRLPVALNGDYIRIDERSFHDLVAQMAEYARSVKYVDESHIDAEGKIIGNDREDNWEEFFKDIYDYQNHTLCLTELRNREAEGTLSPHLALMLSFLKMFQVQQQNLNKITDRHLNFYYKDILRFTPRKGSSGNVVVFPSLTKKTREVVIPKETLFDAGEDINGGKLYYASVDEFTVSNASISSVKLIATNGNATTIPSDNTFGKGSQDSNSTGRILDAYPDNSYGFAVVSANFLNLDRNWSISHLNDLFKLSEVAYTGEDGWVQMSYTDNVWKSNAGAVISKYDKDVHGVGFDTELPVIRFITKAQGLDINVNEISRLEIDVTDSTNLKLTNLFGDVENRVGALPFGPLCRQNDFFVVKSPEGTIIKQISSGNLSIADNSHYSTHSCDNKWTFTLSDNFFDQQLGAVEIAMNLAQYTVSSDTSYLKKVKALEKIPCITQPYTASYSLKLGGKDLILPISPMGVASPINAVRTSKSTEPLSLISPVESIFGEFMKIRSVTSKFTSYRKYLGKESVQTKLVSANEKVQEEESLCITVDNLTGETILSIFFDIDDTDTDVRDRCIKWDIMSGNSWNEFEEKDILKDTTNGLVNSGIVRIKINYDKIEPTAYLADNQVLIRAVGTFKGIKNVRSQALELSFSNKSEGAEPVGVALPASTISKLVKNIAGIKGIEQTFNGEAGTRMEDENLFRCRVSEKLRHKGKAITKWDYERIVLEKFPQVAEIRCIPFCDINRLYAPGKVLLLVIPDNKYKDQDKPLQPTIGAKLKSQICDSIKEFTSPFTTVLVDDPQYDEVKILCKVKLRLGFDNKNYYRDTINNELTKFISPWCDSTESAQFSNSISMSDIIYHLENLKYVDVVEDLFVLVFKNGLVADELDDKIKGLAAADNDFETQSSLCRYLEYSKLDKKRRFKKAGEVLIECMSFEVSELSETIGAVNPTSVLTSIEKHCIEIV